MAYERICIVDNSKYEYCSKCNRFNSLETWRYLFCSENCRAIWSVVEKYMAKKIDALEAKRELNGLDLSSICNSTGSVKKTLDEIMNIKEIVPENAIVQKTIPEVIETSVEENITAAIDTEETKPRMRKKYKNIVSD